MIVTGMKRKIEKVFFLEIGSSDFDDKKINYVMGLNNRMLKRNYEKIFSNKTVEKNK